MTEKTAVMTVRVPREVIDTLEGIDRRKMLETLVKWLNEGKLVREEDQIVIRGSVYTEDKSVYTQDESVYTNDCDGCPYIENALDMSKFNEVCEYKGLDRQKAIDRCVQMLWR